MSVKDVKAVEDIVNNVASKNEAVFARETPLSDAKSIQGLRAVFDEVSSGFINCYFYMYFIKVKQIAV